MVSKSPSLKEAREFFASELQQVLEGQRISTPPEASDYLADLLVRHIQSDVFYHKTADGKLQDPLLADLYLKSMQADIEQQRFFLQRLGDLCLLLTGFFGASLSRKINGIEYYFGMGGGAYHKLAKLQKENPSQAVFTELGTKFQSFSEVIGEFGERSGMKNNQDLLRVYERWMFTGSDRLSRILKDNGIQAPTVINCKIKH